MKIYQAGFQLSMEIRESYMYLRNATDSSLDSVIYAKLEDLIICEDNMYDKLTLEEVQHYLDEIDAQHIDGDDVIDRYYRKLDIRRRKLLGEAVLFDCFTIESLISGGININILCMINRKIKTIGNDNLLEEEVLFRLANYLNVVKFDLFSQSSFAERYALEFDYNIDNIREVNLLAITQTDKLRTVLLNCAKRCIMGLVDIKDDENNIETLFNNLYGMACLELLLSLFDRHQLSEIIICYNDTIRGKKKCLQFEHISSVLNKRKEELDN